LVVGIAACSGSGPGGGRQSDDIVGGTSAADYPEAVLVDLYKSKSLYAMCSGSLIAPSVVLTAGHCVHGISSWVVTAPAASGQKANGIRAETYDWNATGEAVNPDEHDIGLVFLDQPIELSTYPKLAAEPLASNKTVYNIGRIQDGKLSMTELFVSKTVKVKSAASSGYPFDYVATETIEPGDSGGPDVEPGPAPHTIVAVNSGAGGGTEVLARVDLVRDWILGRVAAAGGASSSSSGSGGSTSKCSHDLCLAGGKLTKSCDPCVTQVCAVDSYCCAHGWDATCVGEAADICGAACGGACGSVTTAGKCKGDELEYCDGGSLQTVDCTAYGLGCGFNPDAGEYDCL
jgi:hypothetical protein